MLENMKVESLVRVDVRPSDRRFPISYLCARGTVTGDPTKAQNFLDQPVANLIKWAIGKKFAMTLVDDNRCLMEVNEHGVIAGMSPASEAKAEVEDIQEGQPALYGTW